LIEFNQGISALLPEIAMIIYLSEGSKNLFFKNHEGESLSISQQDTFQATCAGVLTSEGIQFELPALLPGTYQFELGPLYGSLVVP
jgi:hypothetical protein